MPPITGRNPSPIASAPAGEARPARRVWRLKYCAEAPALDVLHDEHVEEDREERRGPRHASSDPPPADPAACPADHPDRGGREHERRGQHDELEPHEEPGDGEEDRRHGASDARRGEQPDGEQSAPVVNHR